MSAGFSKTFPKFSNAQTAVISTSTSGDNTLVAGVAGQTIRVLRIILTVGVAVSVSFKDGSTLRTGVMPMAVGTPLVIDMTDNPLILTAGNSFVLTLSGAQAVGGFVSYCQD